MSGLKTIAMNGYLDGIIEDVRKRKFAVRTLCPTRKLRREDIEKWARNNGLIVDFKDNWTFVVAQP